MDTKKIKLYSGILFGRTGNSIEARFKLIKGIEKRGVDNLYKGLRVDNITPSHYVMGFVRNDPANPNDIKFWSDEHAKKWFGKRNSVFYYDENSSLYYDLLDEEKGCELIDDMIKTAKVGCCNIKKLNNYSEIEKVKVLTKKGLKIK